MNKLSPPDLALYRATDEVLHYLWDPIGIATVPQARDEYHGYLPRVFGMIKNGSNEEEIADFLGSIVVERMGLAARPDHDRSIARHLLDWRAATSKQQD